MPLYDFKCPKCNKIVEELVYPGEEKNFYCKDCKTKMEKIFPDSVSFRMTDNFIMGRDKPPTKENADKLESFKENSKLDPYKNFRDK